MGSEHTSPKYGTLAYCRAKADGDREESGSRKVTVISPSVSFFSETGQNFPCERHPPCTRRKEDILITRGEDWG